MNKNISCDGGGKERAESGADERQLQVRRRSMVDQRPNVRVETGPGGALGVAALHARPVREAIDLGTHPRLPRERSGQT